MEHTECVESMCNCKDGYEAGTVEACKEKRKYEQWD